MKNYALVGGAIVLAIVVALWVVNARVVQSPDAPVTVATTTTTVSTTTATTTTTGGGGKACTMEAKLCSDGSYVGRTGPNCEFTPCPTIIAPYKSGVRGSVLLGPTCPVERIPPDPACAEKPYATAITVYRTGSSVPFVIGNSDASGAFEFSLPPGSYTLAASGGTMLPRCNPVTVTVGATGYATTTISCDTGIR